MKKHGFLFGLMPAAVVAMVLASCSREDSVSSSSPSETDIVNTGSSGSDTGDSSQTDNSGTGDSSASTTIPTLDPSASPWNEAVTDLMVQHLGGNIIPFIDLGETEVDAEYVFNDPDDGYRSYLLLEGGNFLASRLEDAVAEYKEYGYEALTFGEEFYASSDTYRVDVEAYRNYNGLFEVKAYYNERFDPESVTDWDLDTKQLIKEHFGRFDVPFVYLGTTTYGASILDDGSLQVLGGSWNDQVLAEFTAAFDGYQISDDEQYLSTLHASKEDKGGVLTATIEQYNGLARLSVSLEEKFDPTNQTGWSAAVESAMKSALNQTVLPYVYLGAVYPSIDTSIVDSLSVTIKGKIWDDSILSLAKTAFGADGWADGSSEEEALFTKTVGKNELTVTIGQDANGLPSLTVSRVEGYDPESLTAWPSDLATGFFDKYGESIDVIPFLYLGTASPVYDEELSTAEETDTQKLVIRGGRYDERMLEGFRTKFASWTLAVDNVHYEREDDTTGGFGEVYAVAMTTIGNHTYKVGLFVLGDEGSETAYLEINRNDNVGSGATAWSQASLDNIAAVLGSGVSIPFFDTGHDTMEIVIGEEGGLSIEFVADVTTYSYRMLSAILAFQSDGWDLTLYHNENYFDNEAWINRFTASKTFLGKEVSVDITMANSSYYRFNLSGSIAIQEEYDESKQTGNWPEGIKEAVAESYGIELPFIYLGTDNPYIYEDDYYGEFYILGNADDPRIYSNARTVLEEAGWTIDETETSSWSVVASKSNSDGNLVTVEVGSDYHPYIMLTLTEVFNPGTATKWSDEVESFLGENLPGVDVPYVYLGSNDISTSFETYNDIDRATLIGGSWDPEVINLAQEKLLAAGLEAFVYVDSWSGEPESIGAYRLNDDGTALRIKIVENYDGDAQLEAFVDKKPLDAVGGVYDWSEWGAYGGESLLDLLEATASGKELVSFVPLGLKPEEGYDGYYYGTPYGQYTNQYMTMTLSDTYFTPYYLYQAKANLEADGFAVEVNPFFNTYDDALMPGLSASKVNADGSEFRIQFEPYNGEYESDTNGYKITILYLPSLSDCAAKTEWTAQEAAQISASLDGLSLPYVNMGSATIQISQGAGSLGITGFNYSPTIVANIKAAYEEAGWEMFETYLISGGVASKTLIGYLESGEHVYTLELGITQSSTTVRTEIIIEMA